MPQLGRRKSQVLVGIAKTNNDSIGTVSSITQFMIVRLNNLMDKRYFQ